MDGNNWRPQGGETTMETGDWRATLRPDSRQRIVNKILETLKIHLPVSGNEGLNELKKIAQRFEENIYAAATSQSDYLRKISLKMLTMESKSDNTVANSAANSSQPPYPVMEGNNWWPQGGDITMETGDWRTTLKPDSRESIVNKIMETLKRCLPLFGNEGLNEFKKIAQRFEEKIYTAATSQSDYLRKISLKMLTVENKSNTAANSAANSSQPPYSGQQGDGHYYA